MHASRKGGREKAPPGDPDRSAAEADEEAADTSEAKREEPDEAREVIVSELKE